MFWASGPMLHPVKPPRNHHDPARQYEVVLMIHRLPTKLLTINLPLPLPKTKHESVAKSRPNKPKSPFTLQEKHHAGRCSITRSGNKSRKNRPKKIHFHAGCCTTPRTGKEKSNKSPQENSCPRRSLFNPQDWKRKIKQITPR